jgi:peptidoglycan/LPS O-acetylase OafA/YrhL
MTALDATAAPTQPESSQSEPTKLSPAESKLEHTKRSSSDVPNFDVLRAVAVSCVLGRHIVSEFGDHPNAIFQPQALGIFGVLLFFIHTSFVLMGSLERQVEGSPKTSVYWPFILRRIFRIYPLAITVIFLEWFVLPWQGSHVAQLAASGQRTVPVLFENFGLVQNLTGAPFVNGTLWTLPLELQMYLVLPAFFFISRLRNSFYLWACWLIALPVAFGVVRLGHPGPLNMLAYSPCFISGAICYQQFKKPATWPPALLGCVLAGSIVLYMALYYRYPHETILGWFVCLPVALALPRIGDIKTQWVKSSTRTVALYSYGVYLWHPFCIWWAFHYLSTNSLVMRFAALFILIAATSWLSYHLVELPLIKFGGRLIKRIRWRPASV